MVVVLGHKQEVLFGTENHGVLSAESGPSARTC